MPRGSPLLSPASAPRSPRAAPRRRPPPSVPPAPPLASTAAPARPLRRPTPDEAEGGAHRAGAIHAQIAQLPERHGVVKAHPALLVVQADPHAGREGRRAAGGVARGGGRAVGQQDFAHADGQEGVGGGGFHRRVLRAAVVAAVGVVSGAHHVLRRLEPLLQFALQPHSHLDEVGVGVHAARPVAPALRHGHVADHHLDGEVAAAQQALRGEQHWDARHAAHGALVLTDGQAVPVQTPPVVQEEVQDWRGRGVQVDVLAVVAIARLVAAPHPQHVDAVGVRVLQHRAAAPHLLPPLPQLQPFGFGVGLPVLHRVMPRGGGVLREPPAKEDLIVRVCALSVDHRSLGGSGTSVTISSSRSL